MSRKILKILSIVQIFMALFSYFALKIDYSTNTEVMWLSQVNNTQGKLLSLALYAVPAIHLVSGLLATIFNKSRRLMIFMGIIQVVTSTPFTNIVVGACTIASMIISLILGLVYLIAAIKLPENYGLRKVSTKDL